MSIFQSQLLPDINISFACFSKQFNFSKYYLDSGVFHAFILSYLKCLKHMNEEVKLKLLSQLENNIII